MKKFWLWIVVIGWIFVGINGLPAHARTQTTCRFTPSGGTVALFDAPLTHATQLKTNLIGGTSYPVIRQRAEHFYIEMDNGDRVWADRRSGSLSGDCSEIPADTAPLTAYPTLCTFTTTAGVMSFTGSDLADPAATLAAGSYVVIMYSGESYFLRSEFSDIGWVAAEDGILGGNCGALPEEPTLTATALEDAEVWSAPDAQTADFVYPLEEETQVTITGWPVRGPGEENSELMGEWYPIAQNGENVGWVWVNHLSFDVPDCRFSGIVEYIPLYQAPISDPAQHKITIPGNGSYLILWQNFEFYYILSADNTGGWADRRNGILTGNCDRIPVDPTPLTAYPTLCTFTSTRPLPLYVHPDLADSRGILPASTYLVTNQSRGSYFIRLDRGLGGWIPAESGQLDNACPDLIRESSVDAIALANATVWSEPDIHSAELLYTLEEGSEVTIVTGPVRGPVRLDDLGDWYEVLQPGHVAGWVWSQRVIIN